MLFRKIESLIEEHLKSDTKKILLIDGARQVGKTYIIRYVGEKLFENFIEINMVEDSLGDRLFAETKTVEDFYLQISMLKGEKMKEKENTLIFIDEIQAYPHLLTLLKFLSQDNKFTYIASGSLLGVTLSQTTSIPMGSIRKVRMYPLDFEEFLYANGLNELALSSMRKKFEHLESLDEPMHNKMMDLFRKYLLIGGLPDAVNAYLETKNIKAVREIQTETHSYYAADAAKYDEKNKLKIRRIYDLLPSNMENKKKRVVAKSIEDQPFDILDINMGCPVPKVVNNGEGSALLKNPELIRKIVTAVSGAVKKPVTAKMRIGFEGFPVDSVEIAKIMEDSGAAAIAVHGRTRQQYYSGHADWDTIRRIKEAVSVPVIGNGDVDSPEKAEALLKETGCDAVMIGRAVRGNPWIFREMNHYFSTGEKLGRPSAEEIREVILRHARWQIEKKGEFTGIREMRKHVAWYTAGMRHSAGLRRESNLISSYQELEALLDRMTEQNLGNNLQ